MGTGIALPAHPGHPTIPGTPPPTMSVLAVAVPWSQEYKVAVGLISVGQLSLSVHFSGFQGITEVYNLSDTGNPNDHKCIPGTD